MAAISSTDAWAVGQFGRVLTMHWDGSSWSVIPAPSPGTYESLQGLAAIEESDIWAVGYFTGSDEAIHGLTEHWDGRRWRVVPAPDASSYATVFYAASALATDDVWAVGYVQPGPTFEDQPVIEHWDGNEWSLVESPPPSYGTHNILYAVTAVSSDDVWAVGEFGVAGNDIHPLVEHWDGTDWQIVDVASGPGELNGIWAASPTDIWSVGFSIAEGGTKAISFHWDGAAWSLIETPSPGTNGALYAVDGVSSANAWAVGGYFDADTGNLTPLTERSKGPCS